MPFESFLRATRRRWRRASRRPSRKRPVSPGCVISWVGRVGRQCHGRRTAAGTTPNSEGGCNVALRRIGEAYGAYLLGVFTTLLSTLWLLRAVAGAVEKEEIS